MNPKVNRRRGKDHQKAVAELLSGLNIGTLGGADVLTSKFSIECKSRGKFVARGWIDQASKNALKGTIPIVVVHETNRRYENDLVVLRIKDFLSLIGDNNEGM
jgi:hypothetical protein